MSRHAMMRLAFLTLILLLIFASRIFRLDVDVTEVRVDEVWSVWQTFGTPQQILQWTPYDWTPLYYLTLGAWREVFSVHPVMLRLLSVFAFMIGSAVLYRVGVRLRGHHAGVLLMLAYGAMGYNIFLSTELRGYALLLAFFPLTFWLMIDYFDRPRVMTGVWLGVMMAAMFYTSLSSVAAFAMLGIYSRAVYARTVWRWWLPGLLAIVLAIPEVAAKWQVSLSRMNAVDSLVLPPISEALHWIYGEFFGVGFWLWLPILALSVVSLAITRREWAGQWQKTLTFILWALFPVLLYVFNAKLGLFQTRYAWWTMLGIALLIGWGASFAPRLPRVLAGGALLGMMFLPLPLDDYQISDPPFGQSFRWLRDQWQPGDALLFDPQCGACHKFEMIDYFTRVYFPEGLHFVKSPEGHRRVWYVQAAENIEMLQRVSDGRIAKQYFGPPQMLFRLYEAPPDAVGVLFENGMRFHGAEVLDSVGRPLARREGEPIHLRLWWSVDDVMPLDYSVGVYIMTPDRTRTLVQDDSAPMLIDGAPETSRWTPETLYYEERTLVLPESIGSGRYPIALSVYFWEDGKPFAPDDEDAVFDGRYQIDNVYIKAW